VAYLQNFYSVLVASALVNCCPYASRRRNDRLRPTVRQEIARHEVVPFRISGENAPSSRAFSGRDHHQKYELLKQRFGGARAEGVLFLDELVRTQALWQDEAARVLGLLATYHREDWRARWSAPVRYRAFSWSAVERILAAQARPRSGWESCAGRGAGPTR